MPRVCLYLSDTECCLLLTQASTDITNPYRKLRPEKTAETAVTEWSSGPPC